MKKSADDNKYPIVSIKTRDDLTLFGLLTEAKKSKTILINIHGTGSNFFCEEFEYVFHRELPKLGISVLFTNNRGSYALDSWQEAGAALEFFEESVIDIDSWIEYARSLGYEKIILQGHSYGTEKVVYYMNRGKYVDLIVAVILLGFADSVGSQQLYEKTIGVDLMAEAKEKEKRGKGYELLTGVRKAQCGELPISAQTYLNYFSPNSELSKTLPFGEDNGLPMVRKIKVPVLAVIGDQQEYTIIPILKAMELLKRENNLVEAHQIAGAGHSYVGKQEELIRVVTDFLPNLV